MDLNGTDCTESSLPPCSRPARNSQIVGDFRDEHKLCSTVTQQWVLKHSYSSLLHPESWWNCSTLTAAPHLLCSTLFWEHQNCPVKFLTFQQDIQVTESSRLVKYYRNTCHCNVTPFSSILLDTSRGTIDNPVSQTVTLRELLSHLFSNSKAK